MLFILFTLSQSLTCDLTLDSGLCLYSGEHTIRPNSKQADLQGYWSFDDTQCLDYSGNSNHGINSVNSGPSFLAQGSSSHFSGSSFIKIPNSASLSSEVFSISFWLYLQPEDTINETGLRWCPILQKGVDDESTNTFERTPGIFIDRDQRRLQVFITTTENEDYPEGEYLLSNARIPYNRWTHIVVVRSTQKIKLYVNGIFDCFNSTEGWTEVNDSPLFVGSTPSKLENCPVPLLIDELKYYDRELSESSIFSESFGAFGQYESRFMRLGCIECSLDQASESCDTGFHLCTTIELHSGGYSMIKAMGWDQVSRKVWSYSALNKKAKYSEGVGLGVCCLDLGY